MRRAIGFISAFLVLASVAALQSRADDAGAFVPSCRLPFLYFDLGANTLVDTQTFNFERIFYVPGAYEYLSDLKAKGYRLGLLVNVPASWGRTQAQKLEATKRFIAGKWTDSRPFDWSMFDLGVRFPPTDAQRKPDPYLFNQAVSQARQAGCESVYQGAIADEIPVATSSGMVGIHVGPGAWWGSYYYPEDKLRARDFSAALSPPAPQPSPSLTPPSAGGAPPPSAVPGP